MLVDASFCQHKRIQNMNVLFIAIPVALLISLIAVIAFVYQVRSGQFDDLETPPRRMLFDDVEMKSKETEKE